MKNRWIWIFCLISVLLIHALPQVTFSKEPVRLYFFYSEESGGQKVKEEFIAPLSKKYPIEIQSFPLNKLENYDLLTRFEKELKQEDNELPVVVIGNHILGGEPKIRKGLEELVKSYAEKGGVPWPSLQVTKTEQWIPSAPQKRRSVLRRLCMGHFSSQKGAFTARE
jgi:hypothetical protein